MQGLGASRSVRGVASLLGGPIWMLGGLENGLWNGPYDLWGLLRLAMAGYKSCKRGREGLLVPCVFVSIYPATFPTLRPFPRAVRTEVASCE